ncbi:hypothetical protein GQ55_2G411200 [Panicum hallii var. hallii]|uniref:Subtilisin-like protease fibronectin type-III domain-containing protein n=1 Tax=Panicum hallii var. hallii TaxID=1504633 RepID=A0A2T7EXV4_9POAL|nr:hypothetical protein GQ55_2G411200 [Panicum hallii var. hallii]
MASITTRLLHHLALFLFLTQLTHSALVPKTNNQPALKPRASNTYIVHANHLAKPSHFASLKHWYTSMVATPLTSFPASYTYDTVMHGFAVQLTGDEARRMATAAGVNGVMLKPMITRTPDFLGLDPGFGAWRNTDFGDGVIIGFVDSGIWLENPSFTDKGLGPVRSSWGGKCVDAEDFNASLCNNKLVGAKAFDAAGKSAAAIKGNGPAYPSSPRDTFGHGTHVASTAAGSEVGDTGFLMFARGTARGVAPKAKIAMYKVYGKQTMADVVAAIDAAVKDGVDIISLSLGDDDAHEFYDDALAIAAFGADPRGVFVVLAGEASTVTNVAPWMTTVGAATLDRLFPANLALGNGVVLTGQSLYPMKSNHTTMALLVPSSCMNGDLTPNRIMGKIVVCMTTLLANETQFRQAGGAGLVLMDSTSWSRDGISTVAFTLPAVILSHTDGEKLRAYLVSSRYPVASFSFACQTVIGEIRAPMVATFSSRGPNPVVPELLKLDVIAPGSRARPNVAGVAALLKKKDGDWTPTMIRSALITTAGTLDNADREIMDNSVFEGRGITAATPFAAGAGHVRPQLALDPGLVYDAGEREYVEFLCALNYTAAQLRLFVPDFVECTTTFRGGPASLNYPSFVVSFDKDIDVRALTRTVTKVSEEAETYNVTVVAPEHVKVTITPTTLEFKERMETKSYTAEFRNEAGGNQKAEWDFGHISWENEKHRVRSPVAFQWKK